MSAAAVYERIRSALCDEHGLEGRDPLDRHAQAIAETVFMAQAKLPASVVQEARERRIAGKTRSDALSTEGSIDV